MKKIVNHKLLLVFLSFASNLVFGESWNTSLNVKDIQTPVAPAFILLGVEPTSIDQPKTPRSFVLSLLNARPVNDFIPRDYAMQVVPYWLNSHPSLTFDDYYNATVIQTLLQTTVISIATTKISNFDSLSSGTSLGLGLNAMFIQGKAHPKLSDSKNQLVAILDSMNRTEDSTKIKILMNRAKGIALEIQKMDKQRVGFRAECAGGSIINFPNDKFENGKMTRYGVWVLPAYRISNPTLDVIALGRYIHNESDSSENYFDFGGRIVSETSDFTLSGEFVYRLIKRQYNQNDKSYRANVALEYQINPSIRVIGSFGRNFKTNERDLIASLGVNLGFGQIPVLNLNK